MTRDSHRWHGAEPVRGVAELPELNWLPPGTTVHAVAGAPLVPFGDGEDAAPGLPRPASGRWI